MPWCRILARYLIVTGVVVGRTCDPDKKQGLGKESMVLEGVIFSPLHYEQVLNRFRKLGNPGGDGDGGKGDGT